MMLAARLRRGLPRHDEHRVYYLALVSSFPVGLVGGVGAGKNLYLMLGGDLAKLSMEGAISRANRTV
jgi:hypothetical protein